MRNAATASVLGVILIGSVALYTTGVVLGDDDDSKTNAGAEVTPSASAPSKAPNPVREARRGQVSSRRPEKRNLQMTIDKSGEVHDEARNYVRRHGDIALKGDATPHTVTSFDFLAGKGLQPHACATASPPTASTRPSAANRRGRATAVRPTPSRTRNLKDKSLKSELVPGGQGGAMANTGQPNSGGASSSSCDQDSPLPPSYHAVRHLSRRGHDRCLKKIAEAG